MIERGIVEGQVLGCGLAYVGARVALPVRLRERR
jgi:hypothetical protein